MPERDDRDVGELLPPDNRRSAMDPGAIAENAAILEADNRRRNRRMKWLVGLIVAVILAIGGWALFPDQFGEWVSRLRSPASKHGERATEKVDEVSQAVQQARIDLAAAEETIKGLNKQLLARDEQIAALQKEVDLLKRELGRSRKEVVRLREGEQRRLAQAEAAVKPPVSQAVLTPPPSKVQAGPPPSDKPAVQAPVAVFGGRPIIPIQPPVHASDLPAIPRSVFHGAYVVVTSAGRPVRGANIRFDFPAPGVRLRVDQQLDPEDRKLVLSKGPIVTNEHGRAILGDGLPPGVLCARAVLTDPNLLSRLENRIVATPIGYERRFASSFVKMCVPPANEGKDSEIRGNIFLN